jgi:hypothetical protein
VLYDLHPATRLDLVTRFLEQFAAGREASIIGMETVAQDAGDLLLKLTDAVIGEMLGRLANAQARLARKEAFYLWTRVMFGAEKSGALQGPLSNRLALFLLARTLPPNAEVVSLSALLGLACLKHPEVSQQATRLSLQNPHWGRSVHDWLRKLSITKDAYPYPPNDIELSSLR